MLGLKLHGVKCPVATNKTLITLVLAFTAEVEISNLVRLERIKEKWSNCFSKNAYRNLLLIRPLHTAKL